MPCPDCRQPFNAFQDQDDLGHAQARDVLADSRTALHLGIRHVRPSGLSDAFKEKGSIKREREPQPEIAQDRKRVVIDPAVANIQAEMQQINNDLQVLHTQSGQHAYFHQQAVDLLHSASVGEILHSLPPAESRSQLSRKEKRRLRKLTLNARAKRRRENQQLLMFERAVKELKEQQKELHQHYLKLSETNHNLTAQLVTTLVSEACKQN